MCIIDIYGDSIKILQKYPTALVQLCSCSNSAERSNLPSTPATPAACTRCSHAPVQYCDAEQWAAGQFCSVETVANETKTKFCKDDRRMIKDQSG